MSETAKAATGSTREQIIAKFEKERTKVSKEIYDNISLLTNLKTLKEVQVNMLSLRQRLLEDNHILLEHLTNLKREYRKQRSSSMEKLSNNVQLRYQSNEKNTLVDGTTADTRHWMEIFENQIAFFNDSMRTVDNIIFGIKTRLDIDKTIGM